MFLGIPASRTSFVAKIETDWDNDKQPGGSVESALNQLAKRVKEIESNMAELSSQASEIIDLLQRITAHLEVINEVEVNAGEGKN